MKKKTGLVYGLCMLMCGVISAQKISMNVVDSLIHQLIDTHEEVPGLSMVIVQDGQTVHHRSYGESDVDQQIHADHTTPYYIASTTKSFVGLLAAELAQEGVLDLDKSITEYAPIKHFEDTIRFSGISIAQLLSHTSCLSNPLLTWQFSAGGSYTRSQLNHILEHKTDTLYMPHSFRYDNLGYNILDLILYEEFSIDWKVALQKSILDPLGMTRSSAYHSDIKKKGLRPALPYTSMNDARQPTIAFTQKNDATYQAAGGMFSCTDDLKRWLLLNLQDGQLDGEQIISVEAIRKAHHPIAEIHGRDGIFKDHAYSLGWFHADFHDHKMIYHTGGFDGYFAMISFIKEQNMGIAILVNESHFGDNIGKLITAFAYDLLLGNVSSLSDYKDPLAQLTKRIDRIQSGSARNKKIRSNRTWKLSKPMNAYSGEYKNQHMGTLTIRIEDNIPKVRLGIAQVQAEPSSSDESMRVELSDGRGQDILFIYHQNQVYAAILGSQVFYKTY